MIWILAGVAFFFGKRGYNKYTCVRSGDLNLPLQQVFFHFVNTSPIYSNKRILNANPRRNRRQRTYVYVVCAHRRRVLQSQ